MYFGPLLALIGVGWQEAGDNRQNPAPYAPRTKFYALLIALLAAQLLIMNTRWLVNDSFLDEPPERLGMLNPPLMSFSTSAEFADQIALRGYDARSAAGVLEVNVLWQALAQPLHPYTVFAHVIDANGQQVGQQDNMPVRDQSPTSCWLPGEYVSDPYSISIAAGARGPFEVELGLYRGDTDARLPRSDAQGESITLAVP